MNAPLRTRAGGGDRRPHAVVIDSGSGGIAATIRHGARGHRVTVLERLDAPGGRACVFRRDGFTFDAGPMIATASDAVVTSRLMTPLDFRDRLQSHRGAASGFEPVLMQSAWFRQHNLSEDVDGLSLVGAGTHPGAGLAGVLSSARVLDTMVSHAADLIRA